jgi:hypothetical protein
MIKVSVEVRNGTARFRVAVRAESIERALGLTEQRLPTGACRVEFPIGPDEYFVGSTSEGVERPEELAA